MSKRSKSAGLEAVTIDGPGIERTAADLGCGLSLAQNIATRADDELTLYVRSSTVAYAVVRDVDGVVLTKQVTS